MAIVERDTELARLQAHFDDAARGRGHLVFLSAEAGGGKTALIEQFADSIRSVAPVSILSCDGLGMPGPFGPLFDFASALGPQVESLLNAQAPHDQIFRAVLSALQHAPGPNVLVGEDAHWSDEATLDLVRFLGRRVGSTRTLIVITHRDDALDHFHPLRRILGDLASETTVSRIALAPLSSTAVRTIASGTGLDGNALFERTGGNPFYVSEIVAAGGKTIPSSIRDTVLGRASLLSSDSRAILDIASTIGTTIDPDLLADVAGVAVDDAIDESLGIGLLRSNGEAIEFRHELTRQVILESLSPPRRRGIHRRILQSLEARPNARVDLAHLAHHAEQSHDADAVLRHAPAAAKRSAAYGAHREAAAQYARALAFAGSLPAPELAELLSARAYECYLTGQIENAIDEQSRAIALLDDQPLKLGDATRWLSRYCWFAGRNADASRHGRIALQLLESLPPGRELAMAYSNLSQLSMLAYENDEAIRWGETAIELATRLGDQAVLAHALTNVGSARAVFDHDAGCAQILEGARIARENNLQDDVTRALTNLTWMSLEHYDLANARRYCEEALEFTADRDLIGMETHLRSLRAQYLLALGEWDKAEREAAFAAAHPGSVVPTIIVANTMLGLIRVRRGDEPTDALKLAEDLAMQTGELQRLAPLRAVQAEAAWVKGNNDLAAIEAEREFQNALDAGDPWLAGNLALWMHRGGRAIAQTSLLAEPFALEIDGHGRRAAEIWRIRGYEIEAGRAFESAGDEASLRDALAIFDRLGAKLDSARTVRALRAIGAARIPRGPRPETRSNVAQLTARELEVLQLMAVGQSNRSIADTLFLSERTVGHHVSSVLSKLQISSRAAARARAEELGLLQDRH